MYDLHTTKSCVSVSADTASFALGLPKQEIAEQVLRFGFAVWHGNGPDFIICVPTGITMPDVAAIYLTEG